MYVAGFQLSLGIFMLGLKQVLLSWRKGNREMSGAWHSGIVYTRLPFSCMQKPYSLSWLSVEGFLFTKNHKWSWKVTGFSKISLEVYRPSPKSQFLERVLNFYNSEYAANVTLTQGIANTQHRAD